MWWLAALKAGTTFLDVWGSSQGIEAEVERMILAADLKGRDAAALEESLTDQINGMQRQIDRGISEARGQIGASGVAFSGSPMEALMEMHRIGMEDMNAAMRERHVQVNRAYIDAINTARGGASRAKAGKYELAGKLFSGLADAASIGFGGAKGNPFTFQATSTTQQTYT